MTMPNFQKAAAGLPAVPAVCTVCAPTLTVGVTDLQNFPADAPNLGMEPNGWAVIGLPTNFWATASTQIKEGMLLGLPAEVLFTPVAYHWDYGDGSTATSATGGASWAALGLREFSDTSTSHVFEAKGTPHVTVTVEYAADFTFGDQDWRPVVGTVTVTGTPLPVVTTKISTVLVAEDCIQNPRGFGC